MTAHRLTWAAGTDRIAHAARPGFARTLCGTRAVDPRWAWPATERCGACLVLEASPAVRLAGPTTSGADSVGALASSPGRSRADTPAGPWPSLPTRKD